MGSEPGEKHNHRTERAAQHDTLCPLLNVGWIQSCVHVMISVRPQNGILGEFQFLKVPVSSPYGYTDNAGGIAEEGFWRLPSWVLSGLRNSLCLHAVGSRAEQSI